MPLPLTAPHIPKPVWWLLAAYFIASLTHFAHNAEFIAIYPNLPAFITRETVYWAWLAVSSLGVAGLIVSSMGLTALGGLLLMAYGACGLDGLLHYTLALCSEHTLATNLTIWFEVLAGVALALSAVRMLWHSGVRKGVHGL
jgi:uncharacterized membrane protein